MGNIADGIKQYGKQQIQKERDDSYIQNTLLAPEDRVETPQQDYSWTDQTGHDLQTGWIRAKQAFMSGRHLDTLNNIDRKLQSLEGLELGTILDPSIHPKWEAEANTNSFIHPADALVHQMEQGGEKYTQEYVDSLKAQKDEALHRFVKSFTDYEKEKFALGHSHPDVVAGLQEIGNAEGWGDSADKIISNPKAVSSVFFESMAQFAPVMAAAGITRGAGAVPAAGMQGYGSYAVEYSAVMAEELGKAGVELSNPAAIKEAFSNSELMTEIKDKARKRGVPIALFDMLSMGIAGRFYRPVRNVTKSRTAGATTEITAAGSLPGAAGEAAAQYNTEGKIDKEQEVLLEGFVGMPADATASAAGAYFDTPERNMANAINAQVDATQINPEALDKTTTQSFNPNTNQVEPPKTTAEQAAKARQDYINSVVKGDEEADNTAWHGTGATIDKFTTDHYNESGRTKRAMPVWGIYSTDDEYIGRWYEEAGADGTKYWDLHEKQQDIAHKIQRFPEIGNDAEGIFKQTNNPEIIALQEEYRRIGAEKDDVSHNYRLNIHSPRSTMLNWEDKISSQSETVEMGAYKLLKQNPDLESVLKITYGDNWADTMTGNDLYTTLMNYEMGANGLNPDEASKKASLQLLDAGIRGVRYRDDTKVGKWKARSKDPHNYISFQDEDVEIDPKYGPNNVKQDYIQDNLLDDTKYQEEGTSQELINKRLAETDEEWATRLQEDADKLFPKKPNGHYYTPDGIYMQPDEYLQYKIQMDQKVAAYKNKRNKARKAFFDKYKDQLPFSQEKGALNERILASEAIKEAQKIPFFNHLNVEQVDKILTPNGRKALGSYQRGLVKFVENPDRTTLPHEVFHGFLDLAADPSSKAQALDIIRKRSGNEGLSDVQAEEIMTQEAAEFFVGKQKRAQEPALKKFYQWVKDILQAFARDKGRVTDTINLRGLYKEGLIKDALPNQDVLSSPDTLDIEDAKRAYQQSPREYTTKMLSFLESTLGNKPVSYTHLENTIKGGLKQAGKSDKAILNRVLNQPRYTKLKGTKQKITIDDLISDIQKELLDITPIKSKQTWDGKPIGYMV